MIKPFVKFRMFSDEYSSRWQAIGTACAGTIQAYTFIITVGRPTKA
jgi:hypothetical protein